MGVQFCVYKQRQENIFLDRPVTSVQPQIYSFHLVSLMGGDIYGCFPMLHSIKNQRDQYAWPVQGIRTSLFNHNW